MDWQQYKSRCDSPEVWSRWMLEQTLELLDDASIAGEPLRHALADEPLAKPPGHKGGEATDMFALRMSAAQVDAVVDVVRRAVERRLETSGTRGRGLGGFLEAWAEYGQAVGRCRTRSPDC